MPRNFYSKLILLLALSILFITPFKILARTTVDLPTSVTVIIVCGDGKTEGVEVCDPGNPPLYMPDLGGKNCSSFGWSAGNLACKQDCSGYDDSLCFTCGNGTKERAEQCDGNDFGGKTCISYGFESGVLGCMENCQLSLAGCTAKAQQGGGGSGTSGGNSGSASGFLPGSTIPPSATKVTVAGSAYPQSDVHILLDGKVIGIVKADPKANFYFETTEIPAGVVGFGFWSEDDAGLKSTLLSLTFRITAGAVTNITGVYLSPTIDISSQSVKQGETVKIYGKTIPDSTVNVHINSAKEYVEETNSKTTGKWELAFDTTPLEEDFHTAKALFKTKVGANVISSGFSRTVSFHVGKVGNAPPCPEADLNHDKRVNITDFSIMMYYWGTNNTCADQNENGKVDLIDFSIMMYYWTG